MDNAEEMVIMLRRIIRATDLRSKQLAKESGLTSPQYMVLNTIADMGDVAISKISKEVNLTQATVTTIIDKLESKGLVARVRSEQDKRVVYATLTNEGKKTLLNAPAVLQDQFIEKYNKLDDWEQNFLLSALQRIVSMMQADKIDASPFLHLGDIEHEFTNETQTK
jgi:DNA-binding MarR family transcriptional regulator